MSKTFCYVPFRTTSHTKRLDLENVLIRSSEKSSVDLVAFFKERSCVGLSCELKCYTFLDFLTARHF